MNENIRFVGLDVHKSSTHEAVAERGGEMREPGPAEPTL